MWRVEEGPAVLLGLRQRPRWPHAHLFRARPTLPSHACAACEFGKNSFDLKILDFGGKNFRLLKNNLDKDIVPGESKVTVKKNRITITLRKAKGSYGYDSWIDLTAKRPKAETDSKADPSAGIMDMMKQMYDDGDDTMKKAIGEAMLKSRSGEEGPGRMGSMGDDLGSDLGSDF